MVLACYDPQITTESRLMRKCTLKDMRTALRVLESLDIEVPCNLLAELSQRIRREEDMRSSRKMDRMSEEDLITYGSRKRTSLRVNLPDGRLLHFRTNDQTFEAALREIDLERMKTVDLRIKGRPLLLIDDSRKRQRITGYKYVCPGLFVYRKTTSQEKLTALQQLDVALQLNMDIELK